MRKIQTTLIVLLICSALFSCSSTSQSEQKLLATDYIKQIQKKEFYIKATSYFLGSYSSNPVQDIEGVMDKDSYELHDLNDNLDVTRYEVFEKDVGYFFDPEKQIYYTDYLTEDSGFSNTIIWTNVENEFTFNSSGSEKIYSLPEDDTEYFYEEYIYTSPGDDATYNYATFYFDDAQNLVAIQDMTYLYVIKSFSVTAPYDFPYVNFDDYTPA